jgi:hypothetical protein
MKIIEENRYDNVIVFETSNYEWGVKDADGHEIVPVGKYDWIDGFDHGLARVRTKGDRGYTPNMVMAADDETGETVCDRDALMQLEARRRKAHPERFAKWGIINEKGEEVLPLEFDNIWNFLNKDRLSTKAVRQEHEEEVFFHDLNPDVPLPSWEERRRDEEAADNFCDEEDYEPSYGEYAGSYAQDVMGYSDDAIADAFEGDPEIYWNID